MYMKPWVSAGAAARLHAARPSVAVHAHRVGPGLAGCRASGPSVAASRRVFIAARLRLDYGGVADTSRGGGLALRWSEDERVPSALRRVVLGPPRPAIASRQRDCNARRQQQIYLTCASFPPIPRGGRGLSMFRSEGMDMGHVLFGQKGRVHRRRRRPAYSASALKIRADGGIGRPGR